jgi:hypothetical protein
VEGNQDALALVRVLSERRGAALDDCLTKERLRRNLASALSAPDKEETGKSHAQ